jgi:hypothetical protein
MLSNSFLQMTHTSLVLGIRIKYKHLDTARIQVCLTGSPQQHVVGSINGREVFASPDLGSNANVITKDCANACRLTVVADHRRLIIQFVNGSWIRTCGIVHTAEWRFGKTSTMPRNVEDDIETHDWQEPVADWDFDTPTSYGDIFLLTFYVVETLVVPVILSSNVLYGTRAFTACLEHFGRTEQSTTALQSKVSNVAVVGVMFRPVDAGKRLWKKIFDVFKGKGKVTGMLILHILSCPG